VHAVADTSTLGAHSCGVWTRADALALLSPGQIDALVRARTWQVPWRGVYADGGHELDAEQRAWAAVFAAGGTVADSGGRRLRAVACGRTAARVWSLPLVDDRDPATGHEEHALDDVGVARRLPDQHWLGRQLLPCRAVLGPDELICLPSGLWVSSPLRTLVDCAGLLAPDALVCALDAALHHGLVAQQDLEAAVAVRQGRPHCVALRTAVGLADGRAESPPETLARLLLRPALPALQPQVELLDDDRRLVARFDLGDRSVRLAVESDGQGGARWRRHGRQGPAPGPPHRGVRLAHRARDLVRAAPAAARRAPADHDVHAGLASARGRTA
jgi:hypothetical protein